MKQTTLPITKRFHAEIGPIFEADGFRSYSAENYARFLGENILQFMILTVRSAVHREFFLEYGCMHINEPRTHLSLFVGGRFPLEGARVRFRLPGRHLQSLGRNPKEPASTSHMSKLDPYRTDPFSRFKKDPDPLEEDPLLGKLLGLSVPDDEDRSAEIAAQKAEVANAVSKGESIGALKEQGKLAFYEGKFQDALAYYLQFFDKSAGTEYSGSRLSFFLLDFRGLVRAYDQADLAYDQLIIDRFDLILAGRATALQAREWFVLMRNANFTAKSLIRFCKVLHSARHEFDGNLDDCLTGLNQAIKCDEFANS